LIELYNSTNDPDLTEDLASTNVITTNVVIYRYNFPSLSTYTGPFATTDSTSLIISDNVALTEEANLISFPTELTGEVWGGDLSVEGDLTAEFLIAGSTNVITQLASLDTRLDTKEPKKQPYKH
jgi:hypothetical protein